MILAFKKNKTLAKGGSKKRQEKAIDTDFVLQAKKQKTKEEYNLNTLKVNEREYDREQGIGRHIGFVSHFLLLLLLTMLFFSTQKKSIHHLVKLLPALLLLLTVVRVR